MFAGILLKRWIMYKIGIVGSDNGHAEIFSKLLNLPDKNSGEYLFPDCRVVGIFGFEQERTGQVARNANINFIAEKPEELLDKVDAAMVVFRHGDLHLEYSLPFIKAGIPLWVEKPFAIKNEDAAALIEAAVKYNTPITGGSTCKFAYDLLMVKNAIQSGNKIGKIKSAMINFPATLENEYGGIYFFGAHLAEMTMAAFGYDVRSVSATGNNGNIIAVAKYDTYQVTMDFTSDLNEYYTVVFGEKGTLVKEIDISIILKLGLEKYVGMLRTGKMPLPLEKLYAPVRLLNAVVKAYKSGKEVFI